MIYSFLTVSLATATCVQARNTEFGLLQQDSTTKERMRDDYLLQGLLQTPRSLQVDMSLSMSMSMSMMYPTAPIINPTSTAPIISPTLTVITWPVTRAPAKSSPNTLSSAPTTSLSASPLTPVITHRTSPTTSPLPMSNRNGTTVLHCDSHGDLVMVNTTNVTTSLDLTFTYWAQINSTILDKAILDRLEMIFLYSVVGAALGCNITNNHHHLTQYNHVDSSTDYLGSCDSTIDGATCFWLETDLLVTVNKDIDASIGKYNAYSIIQQGMLNDVYVPQMDVLLKLEYLTPTLANGTVVVDNPASARDTNMNDRDNRIKLRNWLLGAFGLVLLLAIVACVMYMMYGPNKKEMKEADVVSDGSEVYTDGPLLSVDSNSDVPFEDDVQSR